MYPKRQKNTNEKHDGSISIGLMSPTTHRAQSGAFEFDDDESMESATEDTGMTARVLLMLNPSISVRPNLRQQVQHWSVREVQFKLPRTLLSLCFSVILTLSTQSESVSYMTEDSRAMVEMRTTTKTVAHRTRLRLPALPSSPVLAVPALAKNESFDVTVERCDAVVKDPFNLFSSTLPVTNFHL